MNKYLIRYRSWLVLLFQVILVLGAFVAAFLLRFDFSIPGTFREQFTTLLPILLLVKLGVFWQQGFLRGWWRYASMADMLQIARANLLASTAFILVLLFAHRLDGLPRSVLILDWILCFCFMAGTRFFTRALRENYLCFGQRDDADHERTLIVGAGSAGQMIAKELRQNPGLKKNLVGFVDDDPEKQDRSFAGYPVLGTQEALAAVCREQRVAEIIVAIPSASGRQMKAIVDRCQSLGVRFRTLPGISGLIDGTVSIQQVREVDLEDLLGREAVRLDQATIEGCLRGKRVLVTGAAGSIGSEICRQVARFQPHAMLLFDQAESPLFQIHNELGERFPELHLTALVGDICDSNRVEGVFDEFQPQVVFHAAAYKHVPLMESNPCEAVHNNVFGTRIVADAAATFGAERFVLVSTDKAVNPTSVMGASKRAAELYVQSLAEASRTHFVTVRFGNVLGSAGSVVPTFKRQIAAGGPVTVTHPEVTRFFMTIPEATQLVLQAGSMGNGGEIFLLDMGEPVKIVSLAEELITLSGFVPHEDIEIRFTGLRPGEKLYEELLTAAEGVRPTPHEKIQVAAAAVVDRTRLLAQLETLRAAQRGMDLPGIAAALHNLVPEYRPAPSADRPALAIANAS